MIDGLARTARVITSAALIMVSVFCAFLLNGDPNIKQFGLGMAAAVAVDATIVRCLLVPAIMTLLGRAGWWLPRWLDHGLPQLTIEGEEYFAEREAAAARRREAARKPVERLAQPGERGVDHGVRVRRRQRPAALQPAVEERAPDEVDGEREVEIRRAARPPPARCAGAPRGCAVSGASIRSLHARAARGRGGSRWPSARIGAS